MHALPYRFLSRSITALLLAMAVLFTAGCSATSAPAAGERPAKWAQPVPNTGVTNLYRVDARLYRSGQPDAAGFKKLYDLGIRYDLNLRQFHDDRSLIGDLNITYHRIRINTSKMTYEQLVEGVAFLMNADAPVLVHCLHGSDRTGTVVAGYRIAAHGWTKEEALQEFREGGYGYHSFWFPNLPTLILSIDEEKFRRDVREYRP